MKEFIMIVENTEIEQNKFTEPCFYKDIKLSQNTIENLLDQLSKITPYESFKAQALLSQCSENIKKYSLIQINQNVTRDFLEVVRNLVSMTKGKFIKYTLKLNEYDRKLSKKQIVEDEVQEQGKDNMPLKEDKYLKQDMFFHQMEDEETAMKKEETQKHRKRVLQSITEIGHVVQNISMQVELQGEELEKVGDILLENEKWTKKAIHELHDIWDYCKSNRIFMIQFFIFWFIIILIFWVVRRF